MGREVFNTWLEAMKKNLWSVVICGDIYVGSVVADHVGHTYSLVCVCWEMLGIASGFLS